MQGYAVLQAPPRPPVRARTLRDGCFRASVGIFLLTLGWLGDLASCSSNQPVRSPARWQERRDSGVRVMQLRGGGLGLFSACFGRKKKAPVEEEACEFNVVVHYKGKEGAEGYMPAIVGSAAALGEWDPKNAVVLKQGPGEVRWTTAVR